MASQRYAERTEVSADKSKAEIERMLTRHGADQFMHGWEKTEAMVGFRLNGLMIRLILPLPSPGAGEFVNTPAGRERTPAAALRAYEQSTRQGWRALAFVIKAKLEAIEAGITTLEEEFLSQIVLPDNTRVGDFMLPQVTAAYRDGNMPKMLPGPSSR